MTMWLLNSDDKKQQIFVSDEAMGTFQLELLMARWSYIEI